MKYLLLIVFSTFVSASQPYFNNTDYFFTVKSSEIDRQDTLKLESSNQYLVEEKILWQFKIDNRNILNDEEKTCIQNRDGVFLKNPTGEYLSNTVFVPHPQVKLPLTLGDSIYVEQTELKDYKTQDSVSIRGYLKVVDRIKYGENINDNDVWEIEAVNLDYPNYSAIYYYSEMSGFVYFRYKFDEETVVMENSIIVYIER